MELLVQGGHDVPEQVIRRRFGKVEPALRRAVERARKTAGETRTPLVIYKDGRVVRQAPPIHLGKYPLLVLSLPDAV